MTQPARGNTVTFGYAPQLEDNIPAVSGYEYVVVNLPNDFDMERTLEQDGSVNPSGYVQKPMPALVRGASSGLKLRLTTGHAIPLFYNVMRDVTKNVVSGGFEYIFTALESGPDYGFSVVMTRPPVENVRAHTFKVGSIEIPLGTSTAIEATFSGMPIHAQKYDLAIADVGNAGTYTLGPVIRGPSKFTELGNIHVKVTSNSPLQYTAELTDIAPTFPSEASSVTAYIDPVTLRGSWQNLQGAVKLPGTVSVTAGTPNVTGGSGFLKYLGSGTQSAGMLVDIAGEQIAILTVLTDGTLTLAANHTAGAAAVPIHMVARDFGFYSENVDPVEIAWPGTATNHLDITVNDEWSFAYPIVIPTPSYASYNRFNRSHVKIYFRSVGDTEWIHFPSIAATLKLEWPLELEETDGSRYPNSNDRIGLFSCMLDPFDMVYRERNYEFIKWSDSHESIEAKVEILGELMGDGSNREGFRFQFPDGTVGKAQRPAANPGRINLGTSTMFTTNDAVDSPATITVWSPRDWTAPTFV